MTQNTFKKYKELISKKKDGVVDFSHHHTKKKDGVVDIQHHHKEVNKSIKENHDDDEFDENPHYDHEDIGDDYFLENLERSHAANLRGEHIDTVHGYVHGGLLHGNDTGSKEINNFLMDSHKKGKSFDPEKKTFHYQDPEDDSHSVSVNIGKLDDAIAQNKHAHGMTTYSGLNFNPEHIKSPDGIIHNPGYTSSQAKLDVAKTYARFGSKHILAISHPKGQTGLYIGNNEDMSGFGQSEHLSPRGMKLKLGNKPTTTKDGYHIWHAERIN